jgi:diketogulonate reductase-like aldo/keto reductase
VSNFAPDELERFIAIAGLGKCACNQVLYHLEERSIEHEVIPACEQNRVSVVAYSPFGSGRFPSSRSQGGRVLAAIAASRGATARQVALAFLTRNESVCTIPKAARVSHVEENAGASGLTLTEVEVRRIEASFPLGPRRAGVPTL